MASPLINGLVQHFGEVTLASSGPVEQILWSPNYKVQTFHIPRARGWKGFLRLATNIRAKRFDKVVVVNHSFRSALLAKLSGIPCRVGHPTEFRRFLLTHPVSYNKNNFEADSSANLARFLKVPITDTRPHLHLSAEEVKWAVPLIGPTAIGLQPGARHPSKQIPLAILTEFARGLQDQGHSLVFLGGPDEIESANQVEVALPLPVVNLVGGTTIRESMAILSRLKLFVAADTGLMHLSVGVGCPTVGVFGPTNVIKWSHEYGPHRVVRAQYGDMSQLDPSLLMSHIAPLFCLR